MPEKKISVVITVLNEEKTISELLISLFDPAKLANEIIIIDAGSADKTVELIKAFKSKRIKLVIKKGISRSAARNLGVKQAKNNIVAMTDAGCIAKKDWLKNITKPFNTNPDNKKLVAAGFYQMTPTFPKNNFLHNVQKCFTVFLGVLPQDFNKETFLPSTRSIAFNKSAWKAVGGFPEKLVDTAEDTVFNQKLIENAIEIKRIKNARVGWSMPQSFPSFFSKIYKYARGDAASKVIYSKAKGIESHNIKVLLVFVRYLVAIIFTYLFIFIYHSPAIVLILIFCYLFFAFLKVLKKTKSVGVSIWGPVVQIICDIAVMLGFIKGII